MAPAAATNLGAAEAEEPQGRRSPTKHPRSLRGAISSDEAAAAGSTGSSSRSFTMGSARATTTRRVGLDGFPRRVCFIAPGSRGDVEPVRELARQRTRTQTSSPERRSFYKKKPKKHLYNFSR